MRREALGRYLRGQPEGPATAQGDGTPTADDNELDSRSEELWQAIAKETLGEQQ